MHYGLCVNLIRQWKEKQAARVAQLQAEQKIKQEELLKSARKEIDQFYEEYNQKKAKQLTRNRYYFRLLLL